MKAQEVIINLEIVLKFTDFILPAAQMFEKADNSEKKKKKKMLDYRSPLSVQISWDIFILFFSFSFFIFLFVNRSRDFQIYGSFYDIVSTRYW